MRRNRHQFLSFFAACLLFLCGTHKVHADARTSYLVNMLEKGGNYRIRVQAATTLGKLRSKEAVPALVRSLRDEHELVVISAAAALGQIGDPSVVTAMDRIVEQTRSKAAKSQIMAALRILRALSSKGAEPTVRPSGRPRFLVRVDPMGNSSGTQQAGILDTIREHVVSRLGSEPGVVLQDGSMGNDSVSKKLKREKLEGYIISGSLLRMERMGDRIIVKVGLNVFSNPEYNLLMMPTVEAALPVRSGVLSQAEKEAAQNRAFKAVINKLVSDIFSNLGRDNP